jgi:hypothetical protein
MNAREVNAASKYIYPADHPALYLFNQEVYAKSPNMVFKILERQKGFSDGQKCVFVKLECSNTTQYFRNYMTNVGLLYEGDIILDTIFIRYTDKGKLISFDWGKIQGESVKLAAIADSTVRQIDIYAGAGTNYPVVGHLYKARKVVIDDYNNNPQWVKCFTVDNQCNTVEGFINRNYLKSENFIFFNLSIFESLGVIVALVILIILGIPIFFLRSIISAFSSLPVGGIIICVGLILGLLYVIYQLLENILFELFLINLPY